MREWWSKKIAFMRAHINERNRKIFFLFTILFAGLSIADVMYDLLIYPVKIAVYVLAAISFFLSCAMWFNMIKMLIMVVVIPFMETNALANRFTKDFSFATIIMTLPGTIINIVFAIANAIIGIYFHSAWAGSLAAYYIFISIIRLTVVFYSKHLVFQGKYEAIGRYKEYKLQRICGIILIILSIALVGAVIVLVAGNGGKHYSQIITIGIAAYTFYKLAMSIKNMVKSKETNDPLIITLRSIGHSDALVSLLYLQTALFSAFGGEGSFVTRMNGATGSCVIIATIVLGISMILGANKSLRSLERS